MILSRLAVACGFGECEFQRPAASAEPLIHCANDPILQAKTLSDGTSPVREGFLLGTFWEIASVLFDVFFGIFTEGLAGSLALEQVEPALIPHGVFQ